MPKIFVRAQCLLFSLLAFVGFTGSPARAASATVSAGQAFTLTVTANGTAPFSYQWYKDGAVLTGASTASYAVGSAQTANAGAYTTVVANAMGSTTSDTALIAVATVVAPAITTQPASQTVTAGARVAFTAAASGTPAPTYQWNFNGTAIAGATSSTLSLVNVQAGNAGTYALVATNSAGSATSSGAVLTVNAATIAPAFTNQPLSQTVTAGVSVTFTAAASGTPQPTYQWQKGGVNIGGATGSSYTIPSAATGDSGNYAVVAANIAGSAASGLASLTVNAVAAAPVFTAQPTSQTVNAGNSVTFTAAASGTPAPTYQWSLNGVNLAGATNSYLSLTAVTAANAGSYRVVATNSAGAATSGGAVLTVNGAPTITTQPVTQTITTGATVTFKVVANGSPAPSYRWRKNGSKIRWATGASYTISSVSSGAAGTYSVTVSNSFGSVLSANAVLTVKATTAPAVLRADFNGDGQADLFWQDSTTGQCSVWLMNGTTLGSVVALPAVPAGSQLRGAGDFNGDGKAEMLLQNGTTGECRVWTITPTGSLLTSLGTVSAGWQLAGTGDFNGDGKSDLVWQNTVTGECSVWLMNGPTVTSKVSVGIDVPDWQICGTGDFNRDGQSDILWQNAVSGEFRVWLMAGSTLGSSVSLGTVAPEWQLSGAGDFNGDGQSDLLWQNLLTGECSVWLMNGTTVGSKVSLGTVSPDWILRN